MPLFICDACGCVENTATSDLDPGPPRPARPAMLEVPDRHVARRVPATALRRPEDHLARDPPKHTIPMQPAETRRGSLGFDPGAPSACRPHSTRPRQATAHAGPAR